MLVLCAVILNAFLLQGVKAKGESALGKWIDYHFKASSDKPLRKCQRPEDVFHTKQKANTMSSKKDIYYSFN